MLVTAAELGRIREEMEEGGRRLVFTNGCFDILHAGHVRYLEAARRLGDALAVGLNGDGSVRALKGEGRPVNGQDDRAEVLMALRWVDFVVIFDDPRAASVLKAVRPHIYAKGGDYTRETLDREERAVLDAAGTEIRILPLVPGRSTTALIGRLQNPPAP